LGDLHRDPEKSVPVLISYLKEDKPSYLRNNAARSLGLFGNQAQAAISALTTTALIDPDSDVRSQAAKALQKINSGNPK
jgi:HEAT repeat protein